MKNAHLPAGTYKVLGTIVVTEDEEGIYTSSNLKVVKGIHKGTHLIVQDQFTKPVLETEQVDG